MSFLSSKKFLYFSLGLVCATSIAVAATFGYAALGDIKLFKENITLVTPSDSLKYDGETHIYEVRPEDVDIEDGNLSAGDYVTIDAEPLEVCQARKYDNIVSYKILDSTGNDVTKTYNIKEDFGEIVVSPRRLDIKLKAGVNPKDIVSGNNYGSDVLEFGGDGLVNGDTAQARVRVSETSDGVYEPRFSSLKVKNSRNEDVSDCYTTVTEGDSNQMFLPNMDIPSWWEDLLGNMDPNDIGSFLESLPSDFLDKFYEKFGENFDGTIPEGFEDFITDYFNDKDWDLDPADFDINSDFLLGLGILGGLAQGAGNDLEMMKFKASQPGVYYLRGISYGDYNSSNDGFQKAPYYNQSVSLNPNQYATQIAKKTGLRSDVEIKYSLGINETDYDFTPYFLDGGVSQNNDVYYAENRDENYDGNFSFTSYIDSLFLEIDNLSQYVNYDTPYYYEEQDYCYNYVYKNYTNINYDLRNSLQEFAYSNNFDTSSLGHLVNSMYKLFNSDEYSYELQPYQSESGSSIVPFLTEAKVGNCQNYASSATMILRAFNYPARFTTGFLVPYSKNEVGSFTKVSALQAHARVEVYVPQIGWIPCEFTHSSDMESGEGVMDGLLPSTGTDYVDGNVSGNKDEKTPSLSFNTAFSNYDYAFDVTPSEATSYYLREKSYGDFDPNTGELLPAEIYEVNDNFNPNNFASTFIHDSNSYTSNSIRIDYPGDALTRNYNLTGQYYPILNDSASEFSYADNDVYFKPKNSGTSNYDYVESYPFDYLNNYWDLNYMQTNNQDLIDAEKLYRHFAQEKYTVVNESILDLLSEQLSNYMGSEYYTQTTENKVSNIRSMVSYNYNLRYNQFLPLENTEYTSFADFSEFLTKVFNRETVDVNSKTISIFAMLFLRTAGVPSRVTTGYYYIADEANVTESVSEQNRYYWVEIYVDGYGWFTVDFARNNSYFYESEKYFHGKDKITLSTPSVEKVFDDEYAEIEPILEKGEDTILENNDTYFLALEEEYRFAGKYVPEVSFYTYSMDDFTDTTYNYAIEKDFGEVVIEKMPLYIYTKSESADIKDKQILTSELDLETMEAMNPDIDFSNLEILYNSVSLDDIGTIEADVSIYAIFNAYGENILENYDIIKVGGLGTLTLYSSDVN